MKKIITVILTASLCLGVFAGCGEGTTDSSSDTNSYVESDQTIQDVFSDDNFPASPENYPEDIYGAPILDGSFGEALQDINEEFSDEGLEVYAYREPGDTHIQVHFSPSDEAVKTQDYETIASEYVAMAYLILSNIEDYPDVDAEDVSVVLGRMSAMIIALKQGETTYTYLHVPDENLKLEKVIKAAYGTQFSDTDITDIIDD